MKHDRLSILRAQEAARLNDEKADAFYVEATGRSTRFRDDPAYAEDVLMFEQKPPMPKTVYVDPGAPGGDFATLTGNRDMTLGRTINACAQEIDRIQAARKTAKRSFQIGDRVRVVNARGRANFLKEGMELVVTGIGPIMGGERTISVDEHRWPLHKASRFVLVEAAGGAAPAEEPNYWVAIKAREGTWQVGDVAKGSIGKTYPDYWLPCDKDGRVTCGPKPDSTAPVAPVEPAEEPKYMVRVKPFHGLTVGNVAPIRLSVISAALGYWRPCDKDGWVTHDPKPDSTCPVPDGVKFEAKCRCGIIDPIPSWDLGTPGNRTPNMYDIVAWRPVKS